MAMALEMDGIIECGVIDLVMWVLMLLSKGKWSYNEPPFSKRKALYLLINCMGCILYVFCSTKLFLYLPVNCAEKEQLIRVIRGYFSLCVLWYKIVLGLCICLVEQFCFLASKIFSHG